jgi:hypothetical protein
MTTVLSSTSTRDWPWEPPYFVIFHTNTYFNTFPPSPFTTTIHSPRILRARFYDAELGSPGHRTPICIAVSPTHPHGTTRRTRLLLGITGSLYGTRGRVYISPWWLSPLVHFSRWWLSATWLDRLATYTTFTSLHTTFSWSLLPQKLVTDIHRPFDVGPTVETCQVVPAQVLIYLRGQRMFGDIIAYLGFVKWSVTWFLATLLFKDLPPKHGVSLRSYVRHESHPDTMWSSFWLADRSLILPLSIPVPPGRSPFSPSNLLSLSPPYYHHCDLTLPLSLRVISFGVFTYHSHFSLVSLSRRLFVNIGFTCTFSHLLSDA